jgi:hypothetical protein
VGKEFNIMERDDPQPKYVKDDEFSMFLFKGKNIFFVKVPM